ncbi:hypothetical protein ES705_15617 [subsurface metagenome]
MIQLEVTYPSTRPTGRSTELLSLASSVPIGQRGRVRVRGYNDMSVPRHMGIHLIVKDPDEEVIEDHEDWAGWPWPTEVDPDDDHEFVSDHFDLDKLGTYTITINLLMNLDSPVIVDSYEGALCTTTTEVPPEYEEIQHTVYPYAYIYDGEVEVVTATFKIDPFTPTAWIAEKVADKLASEVRKEGGRVIELKAYADTTPLFWTDIRIDIISTPLRETAGGAPRQAAAIHIPIWLGIILACLAIIAVIIVATLAIHSFLDRFEHKPISEKLKKAWSKPTLFGAINDWEIDLNLTPTPVSELEGMSYQEQLDYADMLAREIAPPGVAWLPWAIGAGVGVLGIGAVALLAGRKKK